MRYQSRVRVVRVLVLGRGCENKGKMHSRGVVVVGRQVCCSAEPAALADEGTEEPPAAGASPLDAGLERLREGLRPTEGGDA